MRFHFPDVTPAQMAVVPERVLWVLCEVIEPPTTDGDADGAKAWADELGRPHRDYDLPAFIHPDWTAWCQNGMNDRGNDRPAYIDSKGNQEWSRHGKLHRDNGQPAVIEADGTETFWLYGARVKM